MSEREIRTVTLQRVFEAPIDLVYDAWTKAEHMTRWMKCSPDVTTTMHSWEPKVGGTFEYHMQQPGVFEARTTGRFIEVDPPHTLAYTADANPEIGSPEMTVKIQLKEVEGGTELLRKRRA